MNPRPLACLLLFGAAASGTARADISAPPPPADAPLGGADRRFVSWVRKETWRDNLFIEAWWTANLDGDEDPERVARICAEDHGYYLIEDGARRYRLRFAIDGRTPYCHPDEPETGPARRAVPDDYDPTKIGRAEPKFRHTRDRSVEHRQGGHSSSEVIRFGLREDRPAILYREQHFRPHCTDEFSTVVGDYYEDWERLRSKQVDHRYGYRRGYRTMGVIGVTRQRMVLAEATPDDASGAGDGPGFLGAEVKREGAVRVVWVRGGRWPRVEEAPIAGMEEVAVTGD